MTSRTNQNLTLLTDLYQITMAQAYYKNNMADSIGTFHLFFRKNPFGGNYAIAAGISDVIEVLENYRFEQEDIDYLRTLTGNDGSQLFESGFLDYLKNDKFACSVSAVAEGEVIFAHEPILRITGPIIQCQILESLLLNVINFQTLIATKASRVVSAANGASIAEFGLRRAQGIDGSLAASKAAYIGGVDSTSSVLAGKLFNIPVKGTHAHSWVMSLPSELEAFELYSKTMPNNCVFLVDTYDTIQGVRNACKIGKVLKKAGHQMIGIRLDSGDLAKLSKEARAILDAEGLEKALIFASNDLDEYRIAQLIDAGARIDVWGVGTKLVSSYDQPALGGVYKLGAIRPNGKDSSVQYKLKLSEDAIKVSNPGVLQVRRYFQNERAKLDVLYNIDDGEEFHSAIKLSKEEEPIKLGPSLTSKDLLLPLFKEGTKVPNASSTAAEARKTKEESISKFSKDILQNDKAKTPYGVYLEKGLHLMKKNLIRKIKSKE